MVSIFKHIIQTYGNMRLINVHYKLQALSYINIPLKYKVLEPYYVIIHLNQTRVRHLHLRGIHHMRDYMARLLVMNIHKNTCNMIKIDHLL